MAKARIKTEAGTEITIEGSPSEVADILEQLKTREELLVRKRKELEKTEVIKKRKSKYTATDLILQLREEGFFDKPKELVEVKNALDAQGAIFPVTTLSPILLRLVRKRNLRRIAEGKHWRYVKGSV